MTDMKVWLNGRLVDARDAQISVFDRGFLFGDGVYEVVRFFGGDPVGLDLHSARLAQSLKFIGIRGFDASEFETICRALLDANGLADASIYLQVTRGAATTRTHMPSPDLIPTVFACASACGSLDSIEVPTIAECSTAPDQRWHRCEIKSIALLGNLLPMLDAVERGSEEVILIRDGLVSEGTSTNVFVEVGGRLVTPPLASQPPILHGIMRTRVLEACAQAGVPCSVKPITQAQLESASEIVLTASRRMFSCVTRLDGREVGCGDRGPLALRANRAFVERLRKECPRAGAGSRSSTPILAS